jgi:hypothetical protein
VRAAAVVVVVADVVAAAAGAAIVAYDGEQKRLRAASVVAVGRATRPLCSNDANRSRRMPQGYIHIQDPCKRSM